MKASTSERNMKIPAVHHVILWRMVAAWRPPISISVPAPPPREASPPPCPACSSTETARISESSRMMMTSTVNIGRRRKYLAGCRPHKRAPGLRIERGAAHQHAVQLPLGEQLGGILEVDAPAVEDPARFRPARGEPAANLAMHLGGIRWRGVLPSADRPDRLVGNRDLLQDGRLAAPQGRRQLAGHDGERGGRF